MSYHSQIIPVSATECEQIQHFDDKGFSPAEIADKVGRSTSAVWYHARGRCKHGEKTTTVCPFCDTDVDSLGNHLPCSDLIDERRIPQNSH